MRTPAPAAMTEALQAYQSGRHADAAQLATRLTQDYPRHPFGWKLLGATLTALGQTEAALAAKRQAVELTPDDAEAHANLGNSLQEIGRAAEAEIHCRRAIALHPALASAHSNLSLALLQQGQLTAAEISARQALALQPGFPPALNNLGMVLMEAGLLAEARHCFEQAIGAQPGFAKAYLNLGNVLIHLGLIAPAAAAVQTALAQSPTFAEAWVAWAKIAQNEGDFATAEQRLRQALACDPEFSGAWAELAHLRKMTRANTAWLDQALALAAKGLPPARESELRYAMGKYCDDVGDYDQAFAHYRQANRLKRGYGQAYDPAARQQQVERLCRTWSAAALRQAHPEASASELPVFIVGMPRSGTSLLEQILASHPDVFGAGELSFWSDPARALGDACLDAPPDELPLARLAVAALANLAQRAGERPRRVVDKMPGNFQYLGLIHAVFPNARIIHASRHPIDTCLSIYFQNFHARHTYANDLDDLAHFYRHYRRLMDHWRTVLPADRLLEVSYEALITDVEGWSRRIVDFLGLPWHPDCLAFHRTPRTVATVSKWQVRQPVYHTSKERWRNYEKFLEPLLPLLELE
ncbi:tetratricopeptide repeat-containing sulfotransferase family protein [Thiocystis violacea]|uniref:tetratricopeptide repeat-containing sulfotransferase family protein n=1 Tax=Thiocystis violacea TaxID=13725 RepID=UPI0019039768|nr:tetratricopeptide repeat-containing sulfotransferase family protein [Thiocystis violacea]